MRRALELDPNNGAAHFHAGVLSHWRGQRDAAMAEYRLAITLGNLADAHHHLGLALHETGRHIEGIESIRRAIALDDGLAEAHYSLGCVLKTIGKWDEAESALRSAIELRPDYAEAWNNLGYLRFDQGRLEEAIECHQTALKHEPNHAGAHGNLGRDYWSMGMAGEAVAQWRKAVELKPEDWEFGSALAQVMNYDPGIDRETIFRTHVAWGKKHAEPLTASAMPLRNNRDPRRRLRVAYLSADLREHPVGFFIAPILANLNRREFEVICYASNPASGPFSARLQSMADGWREVTLDSNEAVAELIRRAQIDILVDLAGHTGHNRLMVTARRAAPVQVSHFGYPNTTGMTAMDYRISDAFADPTGAERFYTETLVRLPGIAWCYDPTLTPFPDEGPAPVESNGYISFGSLNNPAKLNDRVLSLWGAILRERPDARLIMATVGPAENRVRRVLVKTGARAEQIELVGKLGRYEYLALHNRIDICLDPFPYNGAVTTCDALWMGVPVVTREGDSYVSRQGVAVLRAVKLDELIAGSPERYKQIALELAEDVTQLGRLRQELRGRLKASPVMSFKTYAEDLGRAYRRIWRDWCR